MAETTPRREVTRRALVEAAIEEFAARGVDATSVEQLCDAAGFSRGAFYSNFHTKDDLCMAVLEYHRDLVQEGIQVAFTHPSDTPSVEWVLTTAVDRLFRIIAPTEAMRMTLIEIQLRAMRQPELAQRMSQLQREFRPQLAQQMDEVVALVDRRFTLPATQVLAVFEALFFHTENVSEDRKPLGQVVAPVALALTEPLEDNDG